MKRLMIIGLLCIILFMVSGPYTATAVGESTTLSSQEPYPNPVVMLASQDPYPANPGDYMELLFKIENLGDMEVEDFILEIMPEYPFSLDPGMNATRELGTVSSSQSGDNVFLVKYKLRVDRDAVGGENEIKVRYTYGGNDFDDFYLSKAFNVTIANSESEFEVVMQDYTGSSVTLALMNVGINVAYSVIVGIPEQENFRATGITESIIGNLDSGDYTIVTFDVTPTGTGSSGNPLAVEITYTDALGIRRSVIKEAQLPAQSSSWDRTTDSTVTASSISGISTGGNGMLYIAIGSVGIVGIASFFLLKRRIRGVSIK